MLKIIKIGAVLLAFGVAACKTEQPEHYYVLCDGRDGNNWNLVDTYKDENGYLLSCTYQSPDRKNLYTVRCTESGCD